MRIFCMEFILWTFWHHAKSWLSEVIGLPCPTRTKPITLTAPSPTWTNHLERSQVIGLLHPTWTNHLGRSQVISPLHPTWTNPPGKGLGLGTLSGLRNCSLFYGIWLMCCFWWIEGRNFKAKFYMLIIIYYHKFVGFFYHCKNIFFFKPLFINFLTPQLFQFPWEKNPV